MYTEHKICRACGSSDLVEVLDLSVQPPANDFALEGEPRKGWAPLAVKLCNVCSLAQLSVVYDPKILYSDYPYLTSRSTTMMKHFQIIATDLKNETGSDLSECNIMEIGSNDGTLLQHFKNLGVKSVMGVEPAENLAAIANANGIPTINAFFCEFCAQCATELKFRKPDIIIARHVFAHVDDWKGFVKALEIVSHDDTIIIIEVPDTAKMLESNSFDQCYHEHLSYVTPKAVAALLLETPFFLDRVIHYTIHGGSIGMVIRKKFNGGIVKHDGPTKADWLNFASRSQVLISLMVDAVEAYTLKGKTFAGYGASAKSSVWINACGWNSKDIDFIVDSTPQKQGRISPGSDIPIVSESELLKRMPDYCIIFSWNFAEEIIAKNKAYSDAGGKFIVPIPEIKIV